MKNFFLGAVAVIVILSSVGGAYYIGMQTKPTGSIPTPTTAPIPTVLLTPALNVVSPTPAGPSPTTFVNNDNEMIKQALYKKNNWPEGSVTVTVSTNDGTYASGTAGGQGGGGYFFAAKVGDVWKIVADGNGTIDCGSLIPYPNYPKTLIPECYDPNTGKSVQR